MKSENKVWLITGASSGFGRALAEEVLARGERVIGAGRHVVALADLVARAPDRVAGIRLDVSRTEEIKPAVQAAIARFGQIDVLVNNAGFRFEISRRGSNLARSSSRQRPTPDGRHSSSRRARS
jgi:NAD(P)-dependent dehydrogenase (short-subunit alcohol dehydrogenase family)